MKMAYVSDAVYGQHKHDTSQPCSHGCNLDPMNMIQIPKAGGAVAVVQWAVVDC